jgi:TonB-dependent starch-binding outer membrane protein SusC
MRLSAIMLFACLCASAAVSGQEINLSVRNESLEKVFTQLEKQSGYTFFFKIELIRTLPKVTVEMKHVTLQKALELCLQNQPTLSYEIVRKTVVIRLKEEPPPAQDRQPAPAAVVIIGKVVDRDGRGIPGVSISLKNTRFAWTSNADGSFVSVVLDNPWYQQKALVLVFSSIGYSSREMTISPTDKHIIVSLREQVSTLDEIQTTAYSKTSKRFNTGDISTVTSEEIARNPVQNVLQALQGRVPGLFIQEQTGEANGSFKVQVRSLNTLSGGAQASPNIIVSGAPPLYIVDGVEYPAGSGSGVPGGGLPMANGYSGSQPQEYGNALNYLDPSQFESINILKGADATAIYGSRGAFGVILITTKKAKAGKPSLNLNVQHGISTLASHPTLMNTQQYLALRHEAFANDGLKPGTTDYDLNGTWDTTKYTNWQHFFLGGHAPTTRANATYTGGSANSSYLIGANYNSLGNVEFSKGSVKAGGMNFSMNTSTTDKKFVMALSGSYTTNTDDMLSADYTGSSGVGQAPDAPSLYLPNGKLNWSTGTNPLGILSSLYKNVTNNLLANTSLTYTPVTGLSFIASGGYSLLSAKEFSGVPSAVFNPATFTASNTSSLLNWYTLRTFSADPRVEFNRKLGDKSHLDVVVGGSLRDIENEQVEIQGSGFLNDELLYDPASAKQAQIGTVFKKSPNRYIGGFATLNYRWADKYILQLNGRRDGSSLFGNNRQFGNFGSVAGAWIISEEPWFKGLHSFMDFLKIKGSYGLVGGNSLSPYQYINTYSVGTASYEGGNSLTPNNLANAYLHWETDKNAEAGLNFGLLKDAVNVEVIYYFDKVGDQLVNQPLSSITGFTSFVINSPANIHSYGTEITIITHNIRKKDFSWDTKINFTAPRTKLVAYPGVSSLVGNVNYQVGKSITGIKLYKYAGVDPDKGVYNFYNAAGTKGEFTPFLSPTQLDPVKDRNQFVDLAPKFYGGILNSFTYKNFSMDFLVTITDKMGPNYEAYQSFPLGQPNANAPESLAARRWKKAGDITDVAKATTSFIGLLDQNNFTSSTGAYSNATYARLQNLSVSYRFSPQLIRRARLSGLSIYLTGQNLLTISKYGDLDPENMSSNHMPPLRVFTGGINVNF